MINRINANNNNDKSNNRNKQLKLKIFSSHCGDLVYKFTSKQWKLDPGQ